MKFLSLLPLLAAAPLSVLAENESEREMGHLVRIDAPEKATASVIILHGVGSSGESFIPWAQQYHAQEKFKHINFIFPNAPIRDTGAFHNASLFPGFDIGSPFVHSWFNISQGGLEQGYDETQYWEIPDYVSQLIKNETSVHGIPPNRIVAGGFSQGGMVTLGALATVDTKIAGWLYFPTELPTNLTQFNSRRVNVNKKTPVFHGHGLNDTVINVSNAFRTSDLFTGLGYDYHLHLYSGMGHETYFPANDRDVEAWIEHIIPKK